MFIFNQDLSSKNILDLLKNVNDKNAILTQLAQFQNFANPNSFERIFKNTPQEFLQNPCVRLEELAKSDFWLNQMIDGSLVKKRYIPEFLFNYFDINDVISHQILSENYLCSNFLKSPNSDTTWKLLIEHQTLPRIIRNKIPRKIEFFDIVISRQKLDNDEIIELLQKNLLYPDDHYLKMFFSNQTLSVELLINNPVVRDRNFIRNEMFFEYQVFSEDDLIKLIKFVRTNSDPNFDPLCSYHTFINDVNWTKISEFQTLSNEFIFRFRKFVDWKNIVKFQNLSSFMLKRFSSHFSLSSYFEHNPNISDDVLHRVFKRSFFEDILKNRKFDMTRLKSIILNYDVDSIRPIEIFRKSVLTLQEFAKPNILSSDFLSVDSGEINYVDMDFLKNNLGFDLDDMLKNDNIVGFSNSLIDFYPIDNPEMWEFIFTWCTCSEDFIEYLLTNMEVLQSDWELISKHQKLSFQFIEKYQGFLNINNIFKFQEVDPNIIDQCVNNNIFEVKDPSHFFKNQYCSQTLLQNKIFAAEPNIKTNFYIIKYQKILNMKLLKIAKTHAKNQIFSFDEKEKFKYQQPFSSEEIPFVVKNFKFDSTALNIFEPDVAKQLLNENFICDAEKSRFKIINNIYDNLEFNFFIDKEILKRTDEDRFFHWFITDDLINNFPNYFLNNKEQLSINKSFSVEFIKKWYKFLDVKKIFDNTKNLENDVDLVKKIFLFNYYEKSFIRRLPSFKKTGIEISKILFNK